MTRPLNRLALIAFAASALLPAAAFAQEGSAEVRFDDLNLASTAGAATLDKRIELASRQICRGVQTTGSRVASARMERECQADVRRQFEAQIAKKSAAIAPRK